MLEVKRTLVKSGPELWAEVSDPSCLARHLAPFGSIRVVRTQPESLVVWEGERASGCVRLAAAGFGTRVEFEVEVADLAPPEPEPTPSPEPEPEPEPDPEPAPEPEPPRQGFWSRLFRRRPEAEVAAPPAPPLPEPPAPPAPPAPPREPAMTDEAALLVLNDTLDALGTAHHRPFSRI